MSWHGLVQRQCFHFPLGPHGEVVGVGIKISRSPGDCGAGLIVCCGNAAFNVRRHRPDAIGLARQGAEELDQFRVSALADVAVARQQFRALPIIEPLVRPQVLEEFRQAPLEAGLLLDLLHLCSNSFHLAQSDLVDFPGGQLCGRHRVNTLLVPLPSIWQLAAADALTTVGDVAICQELMEAPECRRSLLAIGRDGLALQPRLIVLGNG